MARYTQSLGIDEPLAMYRGGAGYVYHADGLGSIGGLTDANGNIAATYVYDSFGNGTGSSGSISLLVLSKQMHDPGGQMAPPRRTD